MSLFSNLKSTGLEETTDRLGGFSVLESGIYTGTIKVAYQGMSPNGAMSISLIVDTNGREYRETLYITNRKGENFYTKDGKKIPLPGFTTVDDICLVTSGSPLSDQNTEEKTVKLWDKDAKKELPKAVQVLTDLIGLQVTLGILKQTVNKTEKSGDEYVPIAETRDQNVIDKVFHTETKMTVAEARQGSETAQFHDSWKTRNEGKTQDRRELKDGATAGPPKKSNPSAPPTAGSTGTKSLFGKK